MVSSDILDSIPDNVVGLRLCKIVNEELIVSEICIFKKGLSAVKLTLRRASISGNVGPVGIDRDTDYWADMYIDEDTWEDSIALDRKSWNILKNKWMICKIDN